MKTLLLAALALQALAATPASKCTNCARDSHGRIARSSSVRRAFQRTNPCPATGKKTGKCPGYIADHIVALKRGGADTPANMQWETRAEAKKKDRKE
jgi:hypothetical protein